MGICAGVKSVSQNKSITPSSCWMLVTSDLLNVFHWTCFVLRWHDRRYIATLDNYNNIVLNCISNTHSFLCSIFTYTLRFNFCNRFFKTATPTTHGVSFIKTIGRYSRERYKSAASLTDSVRARNFDATVH